MTTLTATVTVTDIINAINNGDFTINQLFAIRDAAAQVAQDMDVDTNDQFANVDDMADWTFSCQTGIPMF